MMLRLIKNDYKILKCRYGVGWERSISWADKEINAEVLQKVQQNKGRLKMKEPANGRTHQSLHITTRSSALSNSKLCSLLLLKRRSRRLHRWIRVSHPNEIHNYAFLSRLQNVTVDSMADVKRTSDALSFVNQKEEEPTERVNDCRVERYDYGAYSRNQFLRAASLRLQGAVHITSDDDSHSDNEASVQRADVDSATPLHQPLPTTLSLQPLRLICANIHDTLTRNRRHKSTPFFGAGFWYVCHAYLAPDSSGTKFRRHSIPSQKVACTWLK